jgi:hypothetical protein
LSFARKKQEYDQAWHFAPRSKRKEQAMTSLTVLGAVVIAAISLSSSAALAQAALSNPDACEDEFANCSIYAPEKPYAGNHRYRRTADRQRPYGMYDDESAWHGVSGDEYGWQGNWNAYAARNGIVCRPGTYYKGADGLRHRCQ